MTARVILRVGPDRTNRGDVELVVPADIWALYCAVIGYRPKRLPTAHKLSEPAAERYAQAISDLNDYELRTMADIRHFLGVAQRPVDVLEFASRKPLDYGRLPKRELPAVEDDLFYLSPEDTERVEAMLAQYEKEQREELLRDVEWANGLFV